MKLWLLTRFSDKPVYDVCDGFVVRATDEKAAREFAAGHCGDEGADTWRLSEQSSCIELSPNGDPGIVIQDFNAG